MQTSIAQFLLKFAAIILAYFSPCKEVLHAVFALFAIDWLTGVYWSRKSGKKFTSYRLRKSISKGASYMVAIIAAFILDQSILGGGFHLINIVGGYIGLTELKSILENLSKITGKDWFSEVYKLIKERVKAK